MAKRPAEEFINTLSSQARDKVARAIKPLVEFGIGTHIKDTKKLVGTPIWEIRVLGKDSVRIFFATVVNRRIILLHGFVKKSQKTPNREITIALKRLNDWKLRDH